MNKLQINGLKSVKGMKFYDIEGGFGEGKKAMLVKDISEIHSQQFGEINRRINENIKRFKNGIDIIDIKANGFEPLGSELGFTKQTFNQTKNIYLLSERGYSKLLKILEDDVAWEQYEKLVDGYFNMRKEIKENVQALKTSELSPELQMFNKMFQALANNEIEQKKIKLDIEEAREEIQGIREAVTLDSNQWRKDTATLINKIANKLGGFEHIEPIRKEAYKILNSSYGVDLSRRLLNKQKNMALEGCSKSKINKVNYLDVIAEDKKLINGYISIVGKLAVKYGIKEIQ
jgi:hypothetical protein